MSAWGGSSWGSGGGGGGNLFLAAAKKRREDEEKRAAAKPEGRSIFGLAENLVHDLGDAVMGIPEGVRTLVGSAGSDVAELFGAGDGEFELDDLAAATWDAVKWTYEPLGKGDFKEFGKRVYEHPLGPVLDAFTIATLGAGGVVKGAKVLGDVGEAGSVASRLTGGSVRKLAEGESGRDALDAIRTGRARGQRGAGYLSRDGKSILEPQKRMLTSKPQAARDKLASPLSPKSKYERRDGGDGMVDLGDYAENPIRRAQQKAYDAISEATGLAERRIQREVRKRERNRANRRTHAAGANTFADAQRGRNWRLQKAPLAHLAPRDPKDLTFDDHMTRRAFANQSVVGNADDVAGVASARLSQMTDDLKRVADKSDMPEKQAALLERVIGKRTGDDAMEAIAKTITTINARVKNLNHRAARIEEGAAGAKIGGLNPAPFKPSAKTPDLNEAARLRNSAGVGKEYARILGRAMTDPEGVLADYQQVVKIRKDKFAQQEMLGTIKVQQALAERGLDATRMKELNQLLELARPIVESEFGSDALLAETAAMKGVKGPRSKAERGIEDEGFAVSRTSSREYANRGHKQAAANRHNPSQMRKPDASKFSSGYNERFGLDAADPRNVIATHQTVNNYRQSLGMWQEVVASMRPSGALAGELPKGYSEVPQGVATRFLRDARAWLDDEAPVLHGDGSPAIDQARKVILEGFAQRFAEGPQMVPTKLLKRMEGEMKPQGRIPVIDDVTGLWRVAIVSPARPAFLVNNIVGQSVMLGVAHGSLGTMRGLLHYAKHGNDLEKYLGGVVGSGQAASIMRETSRMLDNGGKLTGKARDLNEVLGRISQKLTDDPWRRLAFGNEVLPPARKILKRNRDKMVIDAETGLERPYMMRDALETLLSDERVMDRVERKVLDDLVDFDDLSRAERMVVRRILPFYGWIKGSSKMTIKLVADNPLYAEFLYRIGTEGAQRAQGRAGGPLPDYMRGLLFDLPGMDKLGLSGEAAVTTAQFNPFVTPSDLVAQANFAARRLAGKEVSRDYGPDNPVAGTSPLFKAAFAATSGKDPFTGREMGALDVLGTSFPQRAFAWGGAARQDDGIYTKGVTEELAKYLGVPLRNVNIDKAIDQEINPWQSVEFSAPAIDTRTKSGQAKLAALRAKLKEQYGG